MRIRADGVRVVKVCAELPLESRQKLERHAAALNRPMGSIIADATLAFLGSLPEPDAKQAG